MPQAMVNTSDAFSFLLSTSMLSTRTTIRRLVDTRLVTVFLCAQRGQDACPRRSGLLDWLWMGAEKKYSHDAHPHQPE